LRVVEDGVSALVGCLLGSGGGGVIVRGPFSVFDLDRFAQHAAEQPSVVTWSRCGDVSVPVYDGRWNAFEWFGQRLGFMSPSI